MFAWEMLWPIGVLLLGGAIAYGLYRYYTRNRANDAITERATRELYKHPETYDETAEALKKEVRPS